MAIAEDLLQQILDTLRAGKTSGGASSSPGSSKGFGFVSQATTYGEAVKETISHIEGEMRKLPEWQKRRLGNYTVHAEMPNVPGMKEAWLHMKSLGRDDSRFGAKTGADAVLAGIDKANAALLKPLTASLAIPLAIGFGEQFGKSKGWKDLDDSFHNMAKNVRNTGGLISKIVGTGMMTIGMFTTGPLAIVGNIAASIGALHATASAVFNKQASEIAPWNASMATTAMRLEIGDLRRTIQLGKSVEGTFGDLGGALGSFRDAILPLQSMGLNGLNRLMSFGLGFATESIDQHIMPAIQALPGIMMSMGKGVFGAGQAAVGWGQNAGDIIGSFFGELGPAMDRAAQALAGKAAGNAMVGIPLNPLDMLKAPFAAARDALDKALNDPAHKAARDSAKQKDIDINKMISDIMEANKDKPANVVAAGINAGIVAAAKDPLHPVEAFRKGWEEGVAREEKRIAEAEAKDRATMDMWIGRLYGMSQWAQTNRWPLLAHQQARQANHGFRHGGHRPHPVGRQERERALKEIQQWNKGNAGVPNNGQGNGWPGANAMDAGRRFVGPPAPVF